jgi:hypothetical protein
VGLRVGLDRCGKSRPHRDSIPGPSSPQPVAIPSELPGPPSRNGDNKKIDIPRVIQNITDLRHKIDGGNSSEIFG